MSHVCRHPQRQEEGVGPYETGETDNFKLLSIVLGTDLDPLTMLASAKFNDLKLSFN